MAVFMRGQTPDRLLMLYLWVWYARKGYSTLKTIYTLCKKGIPFVRAHDAGCCGNPGMCLIRAHDQKSLKDLPRATHCTDRTQTSGNVTPTVELCPPPVTCRTKVRARRDVSEEKKKSIIPYTYVVLSYHTKNKHTHRTNA